MPSRSEGRTRVGDGPGRNRSGLQIGIFSALRWHRGRHQASSGEQFRVVELGLVEHHKLDECVARVRELYVRPTTTKAVRDGLGFTQIPKKALGGVRHVRDALTRSMEAQ